MKRRTTKKKSSITEKILIGAGVIGGAWALWKYVIKDLVNSSVNGSDVLPITPTPAPQNAPINLSPAPVIAPQTTKFTAFDPTKVLRLNSSPSEELKLSKQAFNSQIELARKRKSDKSLNALTRKRLETIANLPLLDTNTKFGKETEKVAQTILGAKNFTYNGVKLQKIQMWKSLGLGNPYN
jgi:hypothetical protein